MCLLLWAGRLRVQVCHVHLNSCHTACSLQLPGSRFQLPASSLSLSFFHTGQFTSLAFLLSFYIFFVQIYIYIYMILNRVQSQCQISVLLRLLASFGFLILFLVSVSWFEWQDLLLSFDLDYRTITRNYLFSFLFFFIGNKLLHNFDIGTWGLLYWLVFRFVYYFNFFF